MMRSKKARVIFVLLLVAATGYAIYYQRKPLCRLIEPGQVQLAGMVPSSFKEWEGSDVESADCRDRGKKLDDRLVRVYTNTKKKISVRLTVEYINNLRGNFSFNFPEKCARLEKNRFKVLKPLNAIMPDSRFLRGRCLYITGEQSALLEQDILTYYWVVMDWKQHHKRSAMRADRRRSWFAKVLKYGFLVRVDYLSALTPDGASIAQARKAVEEFVEDLYVSLPQRRTLVFIFGAE